MMNADIVTIAKACHEINSVLCKAIGDPVVKWKDLPSELVDSICMGVIGAIDGNTAETSHNCWLDNRSKLGWTLGERDDAAKKHPNMISYDQLPESQKNKDKIFLAVVAAMRCVK
jgi:hypothetical protein